MATAQLGWQLIWHWEEMTVTLALLSVWQQAATLAGRNVCTIAGVVS
jgi:hypothetical protein